MVTAALDAGAPVESVFVAAEGADSGAVQELEARALAVGARVFTLGPQIMERVADTVSPQAVCAVVGSIERTLSQLLARDEQPGRERLLLVCVDVRDPGNLGALVRSAAAAGALGVVCCSGTADPFSPKTVRATAGSIFQIPIATGEGADEALSVLRADGFRLVATTARGGKDYLDADLSGDVAIVLGNEATGLDEGLVSGLDERVTIPMAPGAESLNVAMTATVLCFEVARRRRAPGDKTSP